MQSVLVSDVYNLFTLQASSNAAYMSAYRVVDLEEECGGGERQDPEQDLEHEVEAEHEVEDLQALVLAVPQGEVHCHHDLMQT